MKNLQWWLMKIDRISAWVLLAAIFLFVLSGYGITKGIINPQSAKNLHLNILPVIILLAFTGHVSLALRTTFIRWRIWNKFTAFLLILVFAAFLISFSYIEYFYSSAGR